MFGSPSTRMAPNPRRLTWRSPTFICEILEHFCQAERHARHALIVELIGRVARQMVVRIAVERGIGDHDRGKTVATERPMVRPCHAGYERRRGDAFGRKHRFVSEKSDRLAHQAASAQVAYKSDEVGAVGIEESQGRRIALATRRIAVVAEHLE